MTDFKAEAQTLFDTKVTAELATILGISDAAVLDALQADLIDLCAHYRAVIAAVPTDLPGAPFNMTLTKRADWLEANVINPCERLLEAVTADKQSMFVKWPYPLSVPDVPNRATLCTELEAMRDEAIATRDLLRGQQSEDAGHSQELRAELFAAIARLLREHRPEVKPNRGVYDPELRRRVGVYADAMRLIFTKVTGIEENLDRLIRQEISYAS